MKKLLLTAALVLSSAFASKAESVFATNITTGASQPAFLLISGRANIKQVQLSTSVSSGATIKLYDANVMTTPIWGTNYTNVAYTQVSQYATNYVTTYVGNNGVTNIFTNVGTWTYTNTAAAATNSLPILGSWVATPNTYNVADTDALFVKGVVAVANTNCTLVIYYVPVQ